MLVLRNLRSAMNDNINIEDDSKKVIDKIKKFTNIEPESNK